MPHYPLGVPQWIIKSVDTEINGKIASKTQVSCFSFGALECIGIDSIPHSATRWGKEWKLMDLMEGRKWDFDHFFFVARQCKAQPSIDV